MLFFDLSHAAHVAPQADKPKVKAQLQDAAALLGLRQQSPEAWFRWAPAGAGVDEAAIEKLVADRVAARKARNFKEADRIRDELAARGVVIEDSAQGTRWKLSG